MTSVSRRRFQAAGRVISVAALITLSACSDEDKRPTAPVPPVVAPVDYALIADYSEDACVLAARLATGPWIDVALAAEIQDALDRTRPLDPRFDAIHPFPDFVLRDLVVAPVPSVAARWSGGLLLTGDPYLDTLGVHLGLKEAQAGLSGDWFKLTFDLPLAMPYVADLYQQSSLVQFAEPDGIGGDGDRIWVFRKSEQWHIVYSEGRGDCPAGCTYRTVFYVDLPAGGNGRIVEAHAPDHPEPWPNIYRWNIPERYHAAFFGTVANLLDHYENAEWWVRRHAIEATSRLFTCTYAPYGEDIGPIWLQMRADILPQRQLVIGRLQAHLTDPDPDVRASATRVLKKIGGGNLTAW